ncbi:MAG: hypothetical protein Q9182_007045 [Xanthomendoza sp. 2 TL-2023]
MISPIREILTKVVPFPITDFFTGDSDYSRGLLDQDILVRVRAGADDGGAQSNLGGNTPAIVGYDSNLKAVATSSASSSVYTSDGQFGALNILGAVKRQHLTSPLVALTVSVFQMCTWSGQTIKNIPNLDSRGKDDVQGYCRGTFKWSGTADGQYQASTLAITGDETTKGEKRSVGNGTNPANTTVAVFHETGHRSKIVVATSKD